MLSRQFIAKTRRLKGFIVSFQWVNGEPAMCLLRQFMGAKSAFVICLSAAYKYTDVAFLVPQSARIAAHFGMKGERQAAKNIADVIVDCLEDLVKMKPEPMEAEIERLGRDPIPEWDGKNRILTLH
jgi:hypothetical protein